MANTQSAHILSIQGSPPSISKHYQGDGGVFCVATGFAEWTPATGGTLEIMRLPANANVTRLEVAHDDMATTSITVDIGLYENGSGTSIGTVIDLDCYADGIDFDGAGVMADYRFSALGIETSGLSVHESITLLTEAEGLAEGTVTLVLTCAAATAGIAGTIAWRVEYTM